mgnify:CR=1 FL=1
MGVAAVVHREALNGAADQRPFVGRWGVPVEVTDWICRSGSE